MRRTAAILMLTIAIPICGCGGREIVDEVPLSPEEPSAEDPIVTANEIQVPTLINGQTIVVDGENWVIEQEEMRDVIIHDTIQNDDGSYTAKVSFSATRDDRSVAVDATVSYTAEKAKIAGGAGEILIHALSSFEPSSIEQVDD